MSNELPIRDLLQRAHQGDEAALESLCRDYYDHICRAIRRRLQSMHIEGAVRPSDIFDDAIVRILESPEKFTPRDEEHLIGFVMRVVDRQMCDVFRKLIARRRDIRRLDSQSIENQELIDHHSDSTYVAIFHEFDAWAAVNLSAEERQILEWRCDHVHWIEIGRRLSIPQNSARKRHARALNRVREHLAERD